MIVRRMGDIWERGVMYRDDQAASELRHIIVEIRSYRLSGTSVVYYRYSIFHDKSVSRVLKGWRTDPVTA